MEKQVLSLIQRTRHQECVTDSAVTVLITRSFAFVEKTSWMAPTTFLNDSVMDSTGEGRAIQSLPELCMLSKRSLKKVTAHSSQIFPNWWQADLLGFG